jgi:hypothetical protein
MRITARLIGSTEGRGDPSREFLVISLSVGQLIRSRSAASGKLETDQLETHHLDPGSPHMDLTCETGGRGALNWFGAPVSWTGAKDYDPVIARGELN